MYKSLSTLAAAALIATGSLAQTDPSDWDAVLAEANGQTVYWNAWGGDPKINAFIAWVGEKMAAEYGVGLEHVKLSSTADAVTRVLNEKAAGVDAGGRLI